MENLLQGIFAKAGSADFAIVNNFFDPTTFHYYLLLNHLEQTQQRYNSRYIFLLSPSSGSEGIKVNGREYDEISRQQTNDLMLIEYKKTN